MNNIDLRNLILHFSELVSNTYSVLRLLKIHLFVSIISFFLFIYTGQILEIYRVMAEDYANLWPQAVMSTLGVGFLTFMLWYSARWMTLTARLEELNKPTFQAALLKWLPRLFAVAPVISLGLFLLFSPGSVGSPAQVHADWLLRAAGGVIFLLSIVFLLWTIYRSRFSKTEGRYQSGNGVFGSWPVRTAEILPVVLFVLVLISPIRFPEFVGTLCFAAVFIGLVTFLLSWSSLFSLRTGFPLTLFVIGLAVLWSFLDTNDNHKVRTVGIKGERSDLQITHAFRKWLEHRPDIDAYRERNAGYPIYVIAAEGGGIYAADHAAVFLSRIQDICPDFASHVFAISGISGGSLGASVFAGLLRDPLNADSLQVSKNIIPCQTTNKTAGPLEQHADRILSRDLLSPLVAATVTKDFFQRFLPVPIGSFDRARALEDAVLSAWEREGLTHGELEAAVSDTWTPEGIVPALVLNTTLVETGERVATAPFSLVWPGRGVRTMDRYLEDGEDLSLVTAAVLSARFTYITPAGSLYLNSSFLNDDDEPIKAHFVDGGYFENSGVDTAIDMVEAIRPIARAAGADIRVISLQYNSSRSVANTYLNETLSPVRALLATRTNRGLLAVDRAREKMAGFCPLDDTPTSLCDDFIDINDPVRLSFVHDGDGALPLGWLLSQKSREIISRQIGWPQDCNYNNGYADDAPGGVNPFDHDSACVLKFIQVELEQGIPDKVERLTAGR